MKQQNTIIGCIAEYRRFFPTHHGTSLKFAGCRIRVKLNDAALVRELELYFDNFVIPFPDPLNSGGGPNEQFDITISVHQAPVPDISLPFTVKEPDPGKTKIKEEYLDLSDGRIVRKRLTGMYFFFGRGEHLAIGPCLENINQVVNFINNRYIEWVLCKGALLGHAAAVIWKGKGAAVAGFSGAGKSTFALHMMNHGTAFASNDRLMIHKNGSQLTLSGLAKLPRINPGTILNNPNLTRIMTDQEIRAFSALSREELWELEHKFDASIDECFGPNKFVLEAPMHSLAILNWKHGNAPLTIRIVDPLERMDLLPAFMKSTGLFFTPMIHCKMPEPSLEAYADYLSCCTVIEFSGGIDFEKAAKIYVDFLKTGDLPV